MGAVEHHVESKGDHTPRDMKDRIPAEAKEMLKSLASKWEDVLDANALHVIPLKGAMTNSVFQIKWPSKTKDVSHKVLVRIYGEGVEVFFDRTNEIQTFEFMSKQGQGPRLLGRFSNGRIEEFIHARTLSASDLRDPDISALIATKLKEFQSLEMHGSKKVCLWDRLRNWLQEAKKLCPPEEVKAFRLDALDGEISLLEKELSGDHRIGFCHNDLQYGNIMIDEETQSITIIDYEYASYNPVAFDIANHFCEMVADYHTDQPHILDFSKYPGLEERERFVRVYLGASGDQPSDIEVDQLLEDIEKFTLASHLFWGLWGIISEHVNEIDFDYEEYARQRFDQYWLRRPALLGSSEAAADGVTDEIFEDTEMAVEKTSPENLEDTEMTTKKTSPGNLEDKETAAKKASPINLEDKEKCTKRTSPENLEDKEIATKKKSPGNFEDTEKSTKKKKTGFFKKLKNYMVLSRKKT